MPLFLFYKYESPSYFRCIFSTPKLYIWSSAGLNANLSVGESLEDQPTSFWFYSCRSEDDLKCSWSIIYPFIHFVPIADLRQQQYQKYQLNQEFISKDFSYYLWTFFLSIFLTWLPCNDCSILSCEAIRFREAILFTTML